MPVPTVPQMTLPSYAAASKDAALAWCVAQLRERISADASLPGALRPLGAIEVVGPTHAAGHMGTSKQNFGRLWRDYCSRPGAEPFSVAPPGKPPLFLVDDLPRLAAALAPRRRPKET